MAISCDPGDLINEAKCFGCLGHVQVEWVKAWLMQQIAGDTHTPEELLSLAKCYSCLSPVQLKQVETYLTCLAAQGGGPGPVCGPQTGIGSPVGVKTPEFVGQLYTDTSGPNYWFSTGLTNADWTQITCPDCLIHGKATGTGDPDSQIGLFVYMNPQCMIGITNLRIDAATNREGYDFELCDDLVTLEFPNLISITDNGYFACTSNISLTSLDLGALTTVGDNFYCTTNPVLTTLYLGALTTVGGDLSCNDNGALTTLDLGSFVPWDGQIIHCFGCAFTDTTVNLILARCVANPAYASGLVDTSGGTSAAPSGQGILDKATLNARLVGLCVTN